MSLCLCVGSISTCLRSLHLDTSSGGLSQVGGQYEANEIVSDSEDEKKLWQAETRALSYQRLEAL